MNTNRIADAFDCIVAENSAYYLRGFTPTDGHAWTRWTLLGLRTHAAPLTAEGTHAAHVEAYGNLPIHCV